MDKEALDVALAGFEWWMKWATLAVALGVAGEVAIAFWYERGTKPCRELILATAFGILVAGGVLVEYIEGANIATNSQKLREIADRELAQAGEEASAAHQIAAEADDRVGEAHVRAAEADRQAAEANSRAKEAEAHIADAVTKSAEASELAERERLARVQLEQRYAPRDLDLRARVAVANFLRNFGEQHIDVVVYSDDPETTIFSYRIIRALENAGWFVTKHDRDLISGPYVGMRVETAADATESMIEAAAGLVAAFRVEELDVTGPFHNIQSVASAGRVIARAGVLSVPSRDAAPPGKFRLSIGRKREMLAPVFETEPDDAPLCLAISPGGLAWGLKGGE